MPKTSKNNKKRIKKKILVHLSIILQTTCILDALIHFLERFVTVQ